MEPPRVALPRSAPPTSCSAPDSTWNTAGHWRLLSLHSVSRVDGLREKHCGTQGEAMMRLADSGRCMFALVYIRSLLRQRVLTAGAGREPRAI